MKVEAISSEKEGHESSFNGGRAFFFKEEATLLLPYLDGTLSGKRSSFLQELPFSFQRMAVGCGKGVNI